MRRAAKLQKAKFEKKFLFLTLNVHYMFFFIHASVLHAAYFIEQSESVVVPFFHVKDEKSNINKK